MNNKKLKIKLIAILLCGVLLLLPMTPISLFGNRTAQAVSPLWDGSVATSFAGGTGTQADPFLISTAAELAYFSQRVNSGITYEGQYIQLTQDILLNSMNANGTFVSKTNQRNTFTKIGSASKPFRGTFDGNSYEIIGLYIDIPWVDYQGLFGYADTGSVIRNLKISGSVAGGNRAGSVAAYTNGLITGCIVNSTVTIDYQNYHGGIAGYAGAESVISNCTVSGTVEGRECVGGIAGYTEGEIIGCSDDNAVSGYTKVGGMAGYARVGSGISNCTFSGAVAGTGSYYVGGIAGQTEGLITGCTVSATLTGNNSYIGGVAGYAAGVGSKIIDCTVSGTVTTSGGAAYAGGVAGRTDGEISGCTVNVSVSAPNSYIGGVAGYSYGTGSIISDCTVSGTVTAIGGEGYVGGVAGKTDGKITGCSCDCTVTGVHHYVGGVAGYASTGSEISNSTTSGAVSGNSEVGGVAGYTDGVIKICINTGTVTGNNGHTGGVAGMAGNNSIVSNSFNGGAIDGGDGQGGIGGIVGYASPSAIIHHTLNKGTVEGNQFVGCVLGNSIAEDNLWYNYYYDYESAPEGTTIGDIENDDGAVPIGEMTWEQIRDLLNTDNDEGDDVWSQDMEDDGVPKPGPGAAIEIFASAIKEGRYYTAAPLEDGTSAAITSDSVFTVTFSMSYNESCNLETQTLGLANEGTVVPLPANTSIIMLVDGGYYYKNLTTELGTKLELSEFIKMGSTTENYAPAEPVPPEATKEYLFVFDFSKTTPGVATGNYKVELLPAAGTTAGTMPAVTVAGSNTYSLTASSNPLTVNLSRVMVAGYDYKTNGKNYAYELHLEQGGATVPFPIGTKINGTVISSPLPYAFTAAAFGAASVNIDLSDCTNPLDPGSYTVQIKAYSCTDVTTPRNGYLLANGATTISVAAPAQYAIRASAGTRVFDNSANTIPMVFNIQTLGSGTVKATLQRKYGMVYVNITDQMNKPVTITGGSATLTIPADYEIGTYRFVLTVYDNNNSARAQADESVIIK